MAKIEGAGVRRRQGNKAPAPKKGGGIKGRKPGSVSRLRLLLFGPPKTGKTTAACSGEGEILLIQFDPDGDTTETLAGRDNITVIEPRSQAEIDDLVISLRTVDAGRFDWVVVDSLTFLFFMLAGRSITDAWKANERVQRQYGQVGAAVQQFVHDLLFVDTNLVLTAHLKKVGTEDENGVPIEQELGESEVKVAVSPMVWDLIGPAFSAFGRTMKKTVYENVVVDGKKKRNKRSTFAVSFNDGERSPAGSRLPMAGEYELTTSWLTELAKELKGSE